VTIARGFALLVPVVLGGVLANASGPAPGAGAAVAQLKAISARVDGKGASLIIEASEPTAYVASRPDPLTVYVDFRNDAGLRRECEDARRDGFTGKMAIHPGQVAVINEVFTPTAEAVKRAEAVIAAFADNPGVGTVGIGGVMYDRPHLERARQLLARAKNLSNTR